MWYKDDLQANELYWFFEDHNQAFEVYNQLVDAGVSNDEIMNFIEELFSSMPDKYEILDHFAYDYEYVFEWFGINRNINNSIRKRVLRNTRRMSF